MSKDPAILFYTSDFIAGTLTMTDEQRGKYILLLCLQHQKGRLTEKHMLSICKAYDKDIFEKFKIDKDNLYYNIRLEQEMIKRKKYTQSRRNNAKGKRKAYAKHMEDVNEDVNIIKKEDGNKDEKSMHTILKEIFLEYYNKTGTVEYYWTAKDAGSLKSLITKLKFYCKENEKQIPDAFRAMLEKNKDKWINDNLSVSIINSKFNEIVRKIKGSVDPRIEEIERKFDVS